MICEIARSEIGYTEQRPAEYVAVMTASYLQEGFMVPLFFFFSSRRRHTRCSRDWSSDVCSSDLGQECGDFPVFEANPLTLVFKEVPAGGRSEERRVGKECSSRWPAYLQKNNA